MRYGLILLLAVPSYALTIEQSTEMKATFRSDSPSGGVLWHFKQFGPSRDRLTSVSIHATITNAYTTYERNPFNTPMPHTPGVSWGSDVSIIIPPPNEHHIAVGSDLSQVTGQTIELQPFQSATLSGVLTHEINATLTENLNRFCGDGFAILSLQERFGFNEDWGYGHANLTLNLRIVYEFEPAAAVLAILARALPVWIVTVHGAAGWEYRLTKRAFNMTSLVEQWAYYLATTNGPVEFIDWNTKSHFGSYAVQPRRVTGNSELIQPWLTSRQRMRIEIESESTNLVTISRAFNSLDFKPWISLINPPGKTSIIDEDFEERIPMPWQSGVATTNRSRFYRVIQSKP